MLEKFKKLAKDDTPMVRRGAAQSVSILAEGMDPTRLRLYLAPLLKSLLTDDNDSVKIMAVYSALPLVAKLLQNEADYSDEIATIQSDLVPPFRQAVENKMVSWRLRFSVAEIAA